ncbi:MAG: hypothetical protein ACFFBE_08500 [Promethearchaeota archaeon]
MLNSKNFNISKKIWNLRDYIQTLEYIKEDIVNFLLSLKDLDDSTKDIWLSDVKEFFHNAVSAWEMLITNSKEELILEKIKSSKSYLYAARNRLSQVISELKIFPSIKSSILVERAETAFTECWDAFWVIYEKILPDNATIKSNKRVVKVSASKYHLPCSICSKNAVEFKIGYGRFDKRESLVFRGITIETSLNVVLAKALFKILKKKDLLSAHNFMKKYHSIEGIDAYCPKCDKIYCWEHYNAIEEYDDGFYDCTYGVCPKGHKRMIDD